MSFLERSKFEWIWISFKSVWNLILNQISLSPVTISPRPTRQCPTPPLPPLCATASRCRCPPPLAAGPSLPAPPRGTIESDRPPTFPAVPRFKRDWAPPSPPPSAPPLFESSTQKTAPHPINLLSEPAVGPLFSPSDFELPPPPLPPSRRALSFHRFNPWVASLTHASLPPLSCRTHRLPPRFIGASLLPLRTVAPPLSATSPPPRVHGELSAPQPCPDDSTHLSGAYPADLTVWELSSSPPHQSCHYAWSENSNRAGGTLPY
jgi:hypothetical protein